MDMATADKIRWLFEGLQNSKVDVHATANTIVDSKYPHLK